MAEQSLKIVIEENRKIREWVEKNGKARKNEKDYVQTFHPRYKPREEHYISATSPENFK